MVGEIKSSFAQMHELYFLETHAQPKKNRFAKLVHKLGYEATFAKLTYQHLSQVSPKASVLSKLKEVFTAVKHKEAFLVHEGKPPSQGKITLEEHVMLEHLTKIPEKTLLGPMSLEALRKFIQAHLGDKELNKKLLELKKTKNFAPLSEKAIDQMLALTYKAVPITEFRTLSVKAATLMQKIQNNEPPSEEEKFSFEEFGKLRSIATLANTFKQLENAGLTDQNFEVAKLFKPLASADKYFQQEFQKEAAKAYQSGDITAWNLPKWSDYDMKEHDIAFHLQNFLMKGAGHGAFIYKDDERVMQSHMLGRHRGDEVHIAHCAMADIWRLNIDKLVDPDKITPEILNKANCTTKEEFLERLSKRYQQEVEKVHKDGSHFENLTITVEAVVKAGAKGVLGGHKGKVQDFRLMSQEFTNADANEAIICSAFVTKSIITALVGLNDRLKAVVGEELIRIPYDQREQIQYMDPRRMTKLLLDQGLITPVAKPPIISKVFKTEALV